MKRILVPLDGSDFAEAALGSAVPLARRHGAEIHLLSVVSNVPPAPMAFGDETFLMGWINEEQARVRGYVEGVAEKTANLLEDLRVAAHVGVGRVSTTISDTARDLAADLVVLTTHGRGAFQRAWLGSTADQLLRRLERPLLLPPTPAGGGPFTGDQVRHVLVPLDGSEAAEAVLDVLPLVLPPSEGVRLTLASIVEEGLRVPAIYLPHTISEEALHGESREKAEAYLGSISGRLKARGIDIVETRVLAAGDAAHGLLRYLQDADVEMITLTTHGRGGVSRFFVGGVADKLIRGARLPALIIRRPAAGLE